jgi:hypothetical protein
MPVLRSKAASVVDSRPATFPRCPEEARADRKNSDETRASVGGFRFRCVMAEDVAGSRARGNASRLLASRHSA